MTANRNLRSDQVPAQPGPSSPPYRAGATNVSVPAGVSLPAFQQGAGLDPLELNEILVDLANLARFGGMGCGVAAGLGGASAAGLALTIAAGLAVGPSGLVEMPAASAIVLPDNGVAYVWLTLAGALGYSPTSAPPANAAVYLGAATTLGGAVTNLDDAGVVRLAGGRPTRASADLGYPVDSPVFPMRALTKAGAFEWDGAAWRAIGTPTSVQALAAPRVLAASDAPRQVLDPGSATLKVLVPPARIRDGILEIHHGGAAGTLTVRDAGDATTLATLAPNGRAVLYPSFAPSGAAYPTATTL